MDSPRSMAPEASTDLSALAWVQDELRRSLDAAHKALRRYVKESDALGQSDTDSVDPAVLRTARAQIHQGVGALELVGLPEAAALLRASEAAVTRYVAKPHKLTAAGVDDLERASFALLDFLGRMLAGKPASALSLFPQYRVLQEAGGVERIHPADLWHHDWRWRDLPGDGRAAPCVPDDASRIAFEGHLLGIMRGTNPPLTAARLGELCASLGAGAADAQAATLWKLAAAVFEAQAQGLLGFDVHSKRVASRLLAQFKSLERGDPEVSERLAQDLLFFCAQSQSPGDGRNAPRLAAVRAAYGLARHVPVDYAVSSLGRYDPAWIAQARKRVTAAKEAWSGVAGGEMHRLAGLTEQFSLVSDSLRRLFPLGEAFGDELQRAVAQTQQANEPPPPALAMEVATSLLYIEAALEDADFDNPEQSARVQRLASRLEAVRKGRPPAPLDSWMEDLYRRVSDRQTMGSVVQELRAALSEAEKLIDEFFRNPLDRRVLIPVPNQLTAMRGVLSVLGMDQASAALVRMRHEVDGLVTTVVEPEKVAQAGVFERLASNLGALGFLIDMLSVQPTAAKSLFVFDAANGTLNPVMGRGHGAPAAPAAPQPVEPRLIEQAQQLAAVASSPEVSTERVSHELELLAQEAQAADQAALSAAIESAQRSLQSAADEQTLHSVRGELSEALTDFVATASEPVGLDPAPAPAPAFTPIVLAPTPGADTLDDDLEMREIFLEEAREVIADAGGAREQLREAPGDIGLLTSLRRAFHTLKGSSRMVGLKEFGEAAWACEQIYNTQLAEQRAAEAPLLDFTGWVLGYLGEWVEAIAERRSGGHDAPTVTAAADRLAGREAAPVQAPPPVPQPVVAEVPAQPQQPVDVQPEPAFTLPLLPPDLPSAQDLDLAAPLPHEPATEAASEAPLELPELSFELDLGALDAVAAAQPGAFAPAVPPTPAAAPEPEFETLDLELEGSTVPMALDAPDELLAVPEAFEMVSLDLGEPAVEAPQVDDAAPDFVLDIAPVAEAVATADDEASDEDNVRMIGPLRIGIPLLNIYLNEADELSRRLTTEVAEWAMELHRPVGETAVALAHSLAGSSATVGFADLSQLARGVEHALMRANSLGSGTPEEGRLFVDAAEEIRRLLHQFAAGFLKAPDHELLERLAEHELSSARRLDAAAALAEEPVESELGALDVLVEDELPDQPVAEPEPVSSIEPEPRAAEVPAVGIPPAALAMPPLPTSTDFTPMSDFGGRESRFDPLGLGELRPLQAEAPVRAAHVPASADLIDTEDDLDAVDAVDAELFPIFEEEGEELMPQLAGALRDWARRPADNAAPTSCMRTLHTLKGGARLAGAMRLGELAHRLETRIEHLLAHPPAQAIDIEALLARADVINQTFEALRSRDAQAYAEASAVVEARVAPPAAAPEDVPAPPPAEAVSATEPAAAPAPEPAAGAEAASPPPLLQPLPPAEPAPIDWARFVGSDGAVKPPVERVQTASQSAVRVRAPLLDRLVNQAGEVSIARSRIASGVAQIKGSLADLTENLDRLRQQLRDIELQAETQMSSRMEAAKAEGQSFDPLEFDRFTRFQELTRMMAESVNDVATVQRNLQRSLDVTEDELAAQARLTRDLSDDLLRTRMVEFEGLSDRLYRVVRLAAKETGKQVRLDIVGGSIEVDRGVLDRMTPAFEHLLRNCVSHGIELPAKRSDAGKDPTGTIVVALSQEGNEVGVEFRDDGGGLDLARIREKGISQGLLAADREHTDAELANLIFTAGFSTADTVTELAGRGVGMDVVRSEVSAMGGRIETATAAGRGTSFKLILPLTTAVTQVVMMRVGEATVAVPSTLIEIVRRATPAEVEASYATGSYAFGERTLPFFWLGALLQLNHRPGEALGRTRSVLVVRSAQQRIAIHVDEVLGNQEVVVKNLGPQLSRLPGLAGMTLLASGAVALIYNPVALATLYGDAARSALQAGPAEPGGALPQVPQDQPVEALPPLVLVVDDSLTVRRVTQRLLVREGYRVTLAKDGLDAIERLAEEKPAIVLSDIEMPRMDGFDLVRNIRGDARLADLPVIMITSRIAQKHREYAAQLGVDHYLGKPYSEEDLLALVGRYTLSHGNA